MKLPKKFTWDDSALDPTIITIPFPLFDDTGAPTGEKEDITFYELPRLKLVDFVEGSLKKGEEDLQAEKNQLALQQAKDDNNAKIEAGEAPGALPTFEPESSFDRFRRYASTNSDLLFQALADMTRGKKAADFFAAAPLGANQLAALTDMVFQVNQIEAILASMGNWLMLPNVLEILSKNDSSSESKG